MGYNSPPDQERPRPPLLLTRCTLPSLATNIHAGPTTRASNAAHLHQTPATTSTSLQLHSTLPPDVTEPPSVPPLPVTCRDALATGPAASTPHVATCHVPHPTAQQHRPALASRLAAQVCCLATDVKISSTARASDARQEPILAELSSPRRRCPCPCHAPRGLPTLLPPRLRDRVRRLPPRTVQHHVQGGVVRRHGHVGRNALAGGGHVQHVEAAPAAGGVLISTLMQSCRRRRRSTARRQGASHGTGRPSPLDAATQ